MNVFFFVVDMCYLRSNFEASLVLPTTQRLQFKTDEINSFEINTAAYLEQKSHFNGDNWLGIAWDIRCFQKWTKGRGSFLYEFHNAHACWLDFNMRKIWHGWHIFNPSIAYLFLTLINIAFIKICYESHFFFFPYFFSFVPFFWHTSHFFMSCIA